MATSVFYNGITIGNVLTREFDQTVIRDDSGTDKLFSRFRVTVEGVANANILAAAVQNLGIVGSGLAGTIPGAVVQAARQRLAEDRGLFIYYQDGQEILKSNPELDADNGPKVSNLRITHTSQATVKIQFTIECALVDCQTGKPPQDVINNRWSSTDDYGDDFRCTRTWRGKLRLGTAKLPPHGFRGVVVPPLQRGWRRSRMNFHGEANSLELGYEVVDQQLMGDSPPWPAAKMSITHTEGFTITGAKGFSNFSIHLDGCPGVDRKDMIAWGISIMLAKVGSPQNGVRQFFRQVAVTEHNGDSVSSVEITAQLEKLSIAESPGAIQNPIAAVGAAGIGNMGGSLKELNLSGYDHGASINPGPYGNATLAGLFACYLQSPCEYSNHPIMTGASAPSPGDVSEPSGNEQGTQVTYTPGPIPPGLDTVAYSQNQQDGMYTHAVVTSQYVVDDGRLALPIAKGGGRFGDGGDSICMVRTNPRVAKRIVMAEYERIGAPPALWNLDDFEDSAGIMNYFQRCTPSFQPPQKMGDGSVLYAVDATYEFNLSRAPKPGETYQTGALPWDTSYADENGYKATNFIDPRDTKGLG